MTAGDRVEKLKEAALAAVDAVQPAINCRSKADENLPKYAADWPLPT